MVAGGCPSKRMKLATIELQGRSRVALVVGEEIVDLTAHLGIDAGDASRFLCLDDEARALAVRCSSNAPRLPIAAVKFQSPVRADKILGVGMNYHSFIAAAQSLGITLPTRRVWFSRPRACINGPFEDVLLPPGASDLDYEGELAVVIGRRCHRMAAADVPAIVGGFTVANDLTLCTRALQSATLGKSCDTHLPLGPWLVTADEIGDPQALTLRTWVNGTLRQQASTADMITNCYELIAEISASCTLNPGDVVLTGTPAGSGIFQQPAEALAPGDVVKVEIAGIGAIENRIVEEPPSWPNVG